MVKKKRDIGQEILQGLREIKRGQFGRIILVQSSAIRTRAKTSRHKR
jgi:hypothetical protein